MFQLFLLLLNLLISLPLCKSSDHQEVPMFNPTQCTSVHMMEAVRSSSHCKPMLKVVKLDIPGNGSFTQMTPQFVLSKLCGGGCHTVSHSCVSTTRVTRQVPVILSQCGLTAGLCAKSCATITIEEDTACQCDCLQEQKTCPNTRHSFDSQSCSCQCQNEKEYTLCRDQGRLWDTDECVCMCPVDMVKPCSSGFIFDFTSTCTCIPEEENDITKLVTDERVVRSEMFATGDKKNVEVIIIAALGGISTVFFIIIISLLNSINTLRRGIRSIRQHGDTLDKASAQLYSEQLLLTTQTH